MSGNPVSIQHQGYARLLSENTLQGTGTHRTSGRQAQTLQAYRTSMREDGAELRLVRRACSRLHLDQIRPHGLARKCARRQVPAQRKIPKIWFLLRLGNLLVLELYDCAGVSRMWPEWFSSPAASLKPEAGYRIFLRQAPAVDRKKPRPGTLGSGLRETMNPPVYSDSADRQQPLITHGAGVPAAWRYWPRSVGPRPG